MAKVVVVIPNSRWCGKREWQIMPYAVLILTALLKDHFDFSVLDANGPDLSEEACQQQLRDLAPDLALISGISSEYFQQIHATIALIKKACPTAITILGGVYPTVLGEEALRDPNIDFIFQGHAEERLVPFLQALDQNDHTVFTNFHGIGFRNDDGEAIISPLKSYIGDVKTMVKPDYSKIDLTPYLIRSMVNYQLRAPKPSALISTSYGCAYDCVFCASKTINGRKVAFRPVEDVLAEIDYLHERYNVQDLIFIDDNMLLRRDRAVQLLEALIERDYDLTWKAQNVAAWGLDDELMALMKKSGCTQVTIAVESGSQRVLADIIKKPLQLGIVPGIVRRCKELGMAVTSNFIIGLPGETWDEIRQTFRFAEECDFDLVTFSIATPLPKTALFEIARKQNLLDSNFNFLDEKYIGYSKGFITTDEFTPEELMVLRAYEWDRINFNSVAKKGKIAELYGIGVAELDEHRKKTRASLGLAY